MKIFLSPSNQDDNRYAYGDTNESVQCGKIAEACKAALERNGFEVMLMHDETMSDKVAAANEWGADYYIPIHTNAFNGKVSGTRMFYYTIGGQGQQLCEAIFNRLAPFTPGTSENIRQHTGLYETRMPNAHVAYIEVDFHDVPSVAKWLVENTKAIGEVIAHGICDHAGVEYKQAEPQGDKLYRVQVGAFRNRDYALKLMSELKQIGYDAFIVSAEK